MHIVVPYQMFDAEQNILFYEDGECIKKDYVATPNLAAALSAFCEEDPSIDKIDIVGNPVLLEKVKRQMSSKFGYNDQVEINICGRE